MPEKNWIDPDDEEAVRKRAEYFEAKRIVKAREEREAAFAPLVALTDSEAYGAVCVAAKAASDANTLPPAAGRAVDSLMRQLAALPALVPADARTANG